ncbi:hypothetical protein IV203_025412 [Nitzschia inconspicua]|uniref:Reverse transcriptase zinc-binding domain-containing protein n=2 Tax=Nitzschia inconspicua TaxID=303405 RepID=A0A9K3LI79_9STRA|nr:hypothetical protein IV203_025412 [Nitzschia inconspicua]
MDKQSPPNTASKSEIIAAQRNTKNKSSSRLKYWKRGIDWPSHERSVNMFKDGPHIFLVKFLHGWLPVGKLVSRYDPFKYPSACPSCDEPSEDSKHFLTCPNPERCKWHAALTTSLRHRCESVDTDPALLDLLLWGLNHWNQGTPIPTHRVPEQIAHLLHSQTTIGWDNFLLGRWSKHWTSSSCSICNETTLKSRTRTTVFRGLVTLSASCGITAMSGKQETTLDTVRTPKTRPSDD